MGASLTVAYALRPMASLRAKSPVRWMIHQSAY